MKWPKKKPKDVVQIKVFKGGKNTRIQFKSNHEWIIYDISSPSATLDILEALQSKKYKAVILEESKEMFSAFMPLECFTANIIKGFLKKHTYTNTKDFNKLVKQLREF